MKLSVNKYLSLRLLVIVILLTLYAVIGSLGLQAHSSPTEMDTVAYLGAALQIKDTGGVLMHIPNCINGVYKEATQNPLYLLALSLFAEQNLNFFVNAKLMTFFIGLIFLIVVFECVRRLFNYKIACVAALLMIFNATFIRITTMVACESLMALCFIGFIFFLVKGKDNSKFWIASGVCAALTFLTKSLGILTLPIFLGTTIVYNYKRIHTLFLCKYFWGFFGVFLLISSPLIIRNINVYNTPLYSDSSAVLWLDDWHEYSIERVKSGQIGMAQYLQSHSPKEMIDTLWKGLSDRDVRMLVDGLKPVIVWAKINLNSLQGFHQKSMNNQEAWAGLLMLFCLIGMWSWRKNPLLIPTLFSIAGFGVFVGWFSKVFEATPPTRLLYSPLFLILIFTAAGLVAFYHIMIKILSIKHNPLIASGLFCVFLFMSIMGCFVNYSWKGFDLKKTYRISPLFATQLAYVIQNYKRGDNIWVGQEFMSNSFYFRDKIEASFSTWPKVKHITEFFPRVYKDKVKMGILDIATVVHNPLVFGSFYAFHPQLGIKQKRGLPGYMSVKVVNPKLHRYYQIIEFKS